jgi:hypothetical protein
MSSLHLEAPTPGLARRDSCDSQSSIESAIEGTYSGMLVGSTSNGQLRVSGPGLPRKASYTARPGTDSILIVDHSTTPSHGHPSLPSPGSFLKKLVVRNPTSLRSVRKAVQA